MSPLENPANNPDVDPFSALSARDDADAAAEQRRRLLIARLAEHASGLRAASRLLGDRIDQFARSVATRRAG